MKLFGSNRVKRAEGDPEPAVISNPIDESLDTLGAIVTTLGRYAFDLDDEQAHVFGEKCERWSRHILTGWTWHTESKATSPTDTSETSPSQNDSSLGYSSVRRWAELRTFVAQRRRAEQKFVESKLDGFRELLWDLAAGLRGMVGGDHEARQQIDQGLTQLEVAAHEQSLDGLREAVTQAVGSIRQAVEAQQKRSQDQLASMGQRLAGMRHELLEVRRELQLDPLTRLYHRGAFDDTLRRYVDLALIGGQPLMLMLADLDHFKQINDTYGHPVGDQVIIETARCILRTFPRKNDFVARYGGEEFAAILLDVDPSEGPKLANRLLSNIRALVIPNQTQSISVTCSIGYICVHGPTDGTILLKDADQALLRAKRAGRNRAESANP